VSPHQQGPHSEAPERPPRSRAEITVCGFELLKAGCLGWWGTLLRIEGTPSAALAASCKPTLGLGGNRDLGAGAAHHPGAILERIRAGGRDGPPGSCAWVRPPPFTGSPCRQGLPQGFLSGRRRSRWVFDRGGAVLSMEPGPVPTKVLAGRYAQAG